MLIEINILWDQVAAAIDWYGGNDNYDEIIGLDIELQWKVYLQTFQKS